MTKSVSINSLLADTIHSYQVISVFIAAIDINPNYTSAYFELGNYKTLINENYGATGEYSKAIELNPIYAEAYYYWSFSKGILENLSGSCLDARKAIRLGYDTSELILFSFNPINH
jgi:tetratricopeptide (TPR) repeat protein